MVWDGWLHAAFYSILTEDSPFLETVGTPESSERQQLRERDLPADWEFSQKLIDPWWVNVAIVNSHSMIQKLKLILKEVVLTKLTIEKIGKELPHPLVIHSWKGFLPRCEFISVTHIITYLLGKHSHQTIIFQEGRWHITLAKMNCILRFLLWNTLW